MDRDLPKLPAKVKADQLFGRMIPIQLVNPAWLEKFPEQAMRTIDVPLDQLPQRFHTCTAVPLESPVNSPPSSPPTDNESAAKGPSMSPVEEHRNAAGNYPAARSPPLSDSDYMDEPAPVIWDTPLSALDETGSHLQPPSLG